MFSTVCVPLRLLQALLVVSVTLLNSGLACPKFFKDPPIKTVTEHTCFTAESIRVESDHPSFTYGKLGERLNITTCREFCTRNQYTGLIMALSPTECHCNYAFKKNGKRQDHICQVKCPGDPLAACGALGYLSAYPST